MAKKERLDKLLVDRKLTESREKARRIIMANMVMVDREKINKAGTRCNIDSELIIEKIDDRSTHILGRHRPFLGHRFIISFGRTAGGGLQGLCDRSVGVDEHPAVGFP